MSASIALFVVIGVAAAVAARALDRCRLALGKSGTVIVAVTGAVVGGSTGLALIPGHLDHLHLAGLVGAVFGACFLLVAAAAADEDLHLRAEEGLD